MLASSVVFALRHAIQAAREENGVKDALTVHLPLTAERIRMACADDITRCGLRAADGPVSQ